ncbi:PQQ-dependent sugar dehydrogenase [Echinicola jeungdonensis]|uniref:PQQ-dependent sugar dehydrogenase n=1 Tax=Echinicola jeungdonensis TaxID=709343 RepID=A0ABV5J3A7_9BACT|nr:PQQ-dependent sugar dehydrogenase [Echinicola jeungdonensis]MDN3670575.1 PQQ-dependent sugar dehydrogenase [Echinicola jeungdonensis]
MLRYPFNIINPIFTVILILTVNLACAQSDRPSVKEDQPPIMGDKKNYQVETVVDGLSVPWGMAFLPDGSLLITEREGDIILAKENNKTQIEGGPEVVARGQGGLLDVILHPNYENNGWLYLSYSSSEGEEDGANTAIMRAKLEGSQLTDQEVIYKAVPNTRKGQHFGSRMAFGDDGYLYFSIGERGERDVNPQDITRDGGKIYRLNPDGSIPEDNPFYNESNAKKAIYSYGHRNPQGMFKHPETGEIWVNEHGPRGGDEINIVKKGANYGWPLVSYGINYSGTTFTELTSHPDMEQPFYYWVPSIAPSGFEIITGDHYPEWKGDLLVGSLKFQYLEKLSIENNRVVKREKLLDEMGRIRNVKIGPDGYIYVGVEGKGIVKIIPKN